jgi:L-asparaginase II
MGQSERLIEIWRGDFLESQHRGHAVVVDTGGEVVAAWGDPEAVILPRSACKMIQALPLIESGAADAAGLSSAHLALACASHQGAAVHTDMVTGWLAELGLSDDDLRCGVWRPHDPAAKVDLIKTDNSPCQYHNECSGKHTGFLTLNKHLGGAAEYVEIDHPVQRACLEAIERMTGVVSPAHGIAGCAAPNFATPVTGLARAMAGYAAAADMSAAGRLRDAMRSHPELVGGDNKATTELMRALAGAAAIKSGAEGVFVARLPEPGLGLALKMEDGAERASDAAITALLVRFGGLDPSHPKALRSLGGEMLNRRRQPVGMIRAAPGFC